MPLVLCRGGEGHCGVHSNPSTVILCTISLSGGLKAEFNMISNVVQVDKVRWGKHLLNMLYVNIEFSQTAIDDSLQYDRIDELDFSIVFQTYTIKAIHLKKKAEKLCLEGIQLFLP